MERKKGGRYSLEGQLFVATPKVRLFEAWENSAEMTVLNKEVPHPKAYVKKCNENDWPIMIPSLHPTLMPQTSIEQLAQLGVKPCLSFSPSWLLSAVN